MRMKWDGIGRNKGYAPDWIVMREEGTNRYIYSPWLLFLARFLRSSLRSCANPNSKSFSLIFGFGRFILRPVKIKSTGSVENISVVSIFIASSRKRYRADDRGDFVRESHAKENRDDCWRFQRDFKLKSIKAYKEKCERSFFISRNIFINQFFTDFLTYG